MIGLILSMTSHHNWDINDAPPITLVFTGSHSIFWALLNKKVSTGHFWMVYLKLLINKNKYSNHSDSLDIILKFLEFPWDFSGTSWCQLFNNPRGTEWYNLDLDSGLWLKTRNENKYWNYIEQLLEKFGKLKGTSFFSVKII